MNCPKCNTEMNETVEERWTGKYKNVLSVMVFVDCPTCGYQTDSTESDYVHKSETKPHHASGGPVEMGRLYFLPSPLKEIFVVPRFILDDRDEPNCASDE